MKKAISFLFVSISALTLLSCASNAQKNGSKDGPSRSADQSPAAGDASFSCNIDGVAVKGNETGELQLQNAAYIYPPKDGKEQTVLFILISNKVGDDFYSFRFSFPDKPGTYTKTKENKDACNCNLMLDYYLKSSNNFSRYNEDAITVTITSITATRISGTFSGKFRLSADTRSQQYKPQIEVTDGKFDLPFSTSKMRPE